jgi:hypothetical protein
MTTTVVPATTAPTPARADWETVLQYLGLPPNKPETKALVLLCDRYGLDPLLGHARIIATKDNFQPYITRDGMLEIAHRSGQLDGIVVDEQRRSSQNDGWTAYVSVWRKDMTHPFHYGAQCKDTEAQAKAGNGPEMALARAERRALKRAFAIPVTELVEDADVEMVTPVTATEPEPVVAVAAPNADSDGRPLWPGWPAKPNQADAHRIIGALPEDDRAQWLRQWKITDFYATWPDEAAADALTRSFD